jgi:hypothetical protein
VITEDDVEQAVFGISDGVTSSLGVVIPLAITHQPMLAVIAGLATCAAIGMGGGELLSDKEGSWRRAIAMAVASFVGTVIPAGPFFVTTSWPAAAASGALCAMTGAMISEVKAHKMSRLRSYLQTFSILGVASAFTVGFALVTGAAG